MRSGIVVSKTKSFSYRQKNNNDEKYSGITRRFRRRHRLETLSKSFSLSPLVLLQNNPPII